MSENENAVAEETANAENSASKTEQKAGVDLETFVGYKAGMTRFFKDDGKCIPVTVIKLVSNKISQLKNKEKDGYSAYQVGFYEKRESLINNPTKKKLRKAGIDENFSRFYEVKTESDPESNSLGQTVSLGKFEEGKYVDVRGVSKGKGFQGVMKRYNFSGGPMTHGSHFHRTGGSIGNRATPGKVFKNKKMPGHMGSKNVTVQNLEIVKVNQGESYMLIKGSIPGSKNSFVKVSTSIKRRG